MKISFAKHALLICAMVIGLPAIAANLPDYYPAAFDRWEAHVVTFHNPLQDRDAANTVYVARTGSGGSGVGAATR